MMIITNNSISMEFHGDNHQIFFFGNKHSILRSQPDDLYDSHPAVTMASGFPLPSSNQTWQARESKIRWQRAVTINPSQQLQGKPLPVLSHQTTSISCASLADGVDWGKRYFLLCHFVQYHESCLQKKCFPSYRSLVGAFNHLEKY